MPQKLCLLAVLSSWSNAFSKWLPPSSIFPGRVYVLLLWGQGGECSIIGKYVWPKLLLNCFSTLELRAGEILHTPFKTGISVSYSSQVHLCVSPYGLKIQIFGVFIFPVQGSQSWDSWCRVPILFSLWRTSAIVITLSFVGCLPERKHGSWQYYICPPITVVPLYL